MWLKRVDDARLSYLGGKEHRHISDVRSGVYDVITWRQEPPRALADTYIKDSLLENLASDRIIEIDLDLHAPRQFYIGLFRFGPRELKVYAPD